jgi:hypothetical protein
LKAQALQIQKVADAKYGTADERLKPKFVDLAQKIVKCGKVKQSLDWIPATDYELANSVLGALTFIKSFECWSDRCTPVEVAKADLDFTEDLKREQVTDVQIGRYLKNTEKVLSTAEEGTNKDEPITDLTMSRNPKINLHLMAGFAAQIKNNTSLLQFSLLYFRLHGNGWRTLGTALGKNKTLQKLTLQACHLDEGDNLNLLFKALFRGQPPKELPSEPLD